MRTARLLAAASLLLASAAHAVEAPVPAPKSTSSLAAAAAKAQAAPAPSPTRRVWTAKDLEGLRQGSAPINYIESSVPYAQPEGERVIEGMTEQPQGVPDRLREMAAYAQVNLDRLNREKLAGSNPLLRGLSPTPPRSREDIDKELIKWSERLRSAQGALEKAESGAR